MKGKEPVRIRVRQYTLTDAEWSRVPKEVQTLLLSWQEETFIGYGAMALSAVCLMMAGVAFWLGPTAEDASSLIRVIGQVFGMSGGAAVLLFSASVLLFAFRRWRPRLPVLAPKSSPPREWEEYVGVDLPSWHPRPAAAARKAAALGFESGGGPGGCGRARWPPSGQQRSCSPRLQERHLRGPASVADEQPRRARSRLPAVEPAPASAMIENATAAAVVLPAPSLHRPSRDVHCHGSRGRGRGRRRVARDCYPAAPTRCRSRRAGPREPEPGHRLRRA